MSHEISTKKTIGVVLGVCLVCSVLVSTAAVSLKSRLEENKKLDKIKNILDAGNLYSEGKSIEETFRSKIESKIIELESGEFFSEKKYDDIINIEDFDIKVVAADAKYGMEIPSDKDIAGIKRMPKYMAVYLVKEKDEINKIILQIYGKGLWSTMYGFVALNKDLKTIEGFTFYEHGETPGLGGEVDNPRWKQIWKGKLAYDEEWNVKIEVLKGKVDKSSSNAKYQVDGLSGSTMTTRGVDHLVKFWFGENGYAPFITKLREEGF
jgi:Na+-transporting NADH:ubiquinone oxidoreductase subunit C